MKISLQSLLVIGFLLCGRTVYSQLTVTFPSDRAVFQRNNSNEAVVYVAGYFSEQIGQVEARFVPLVKDEGQPAPANGGWALIQKNPATGNFYGSMVVKGGWYRLEVRGLRDGHAPQEFHVAHVGVGEVFLVAGQSNSTGGDSNPNGPGARYDQVNSVNFQNHNTSTYYISPYSEIKLPCPEFVHLDAATKLAPFGNYAWCWGSFGDKLYEKLRVPVMIFNSGWSSTDINSWRKTIDTTAIVNSAFGYTFPQGLPFGHIRLALNNYINQLGVRAVLWHQGETDTFLEKENDDTYNRYLAGLWEVIGASREVSNKKDLAWMVARASRFTVNGASRTSANVIRAQNDLIDGDQAYPYIYSGPETDPYYSVEYRSDQVHFRGDGITPAADGKIYSGLIFLANLWVEKITSNFLRESIPYPASPPLQITSVPQAGGTRVTFAAPAIDSKSYYNWLKPDNCTQVEASSQQWTVGAGWYQLKIVDKQKNTVFSPKLYVSGSSLPVTWKYFAGSTTRDNRPELSWATTAEYNASNFEVERSLDAVHFETIGSVDAIGNSDVRSDYSYADEALPAGTYYYRLKQIDMDGSYDYSRIVLVKIAGKNLVNVYPNPVTDRLILESETGLNLVQIINIYGITMYSEKHSGNRLELPMTSYPSGLYTIIVNNESIKIVK